MKTTTITRIPNKYHQFMNKAEKFYLEKYKDSGEKKFNHNRQVALRFYETITNITNPKNVESMLTKLFLLALYHNIEKKDIFSEVAYNIRKEKEMYDKIVKLDEKKEKTGHEYLAALGPEFTFIPLLRSIDLTDIEYAEIDEKYKKEGLLSNIGDAIRGLYAPFADFWGLRELYGELKDVIAYVKYRELYETVKSRREEILGRLEAVKDHLRRFIENEVLIEASKESIHITNVLYDIKKVGSCVIKIKDRPEEYDCLESLNDLVRARIITKTMDDAKRMEQLLRKIAYTAEKYDLEYKKKGDNKKKENEDGIHWTRNERTGYEGLHVDMYGSYQTNNDIELYGVELQVRSQAVEEKCNNGKWLHGLKFATATHTTSLKLPNEAITRWGAFKEYLKKIDDTQELIMAGNNIQKSNRAIQVSIKKDGKERIVGLNIINGAKIMDVVAMVLGKEDAHMPFTVKNKLGAHLSIFNDISHINEIEIQIGSGKMLGSRCAYALLNQVKTPEAFHFLKELIREEKGRNRKKRR